MLCFFRRVWINSGLLVQGFVVAQSAFLGAALGNATEINPGLAPAELTVFNNGELLVRRVVQPNRYDSSLRSANAGDGAAKNFVLRRSLGPPFGGYALEISADVAPGRYERGLLNALGALLLGSLSLGFWAIFRLGVGQIELARKQSNFVSAVSHELKTPLTSIRMYSEMLRAGWVGDADKQRAYYDFIFFESERLSRLIANVLQLAKIEQGATLNLSEQPAGQLLDLVVEKCRVLAETAGFDLNVMADPGARSARVNVDEDAFVQIFINLVDNARKFAVQAEHRRIDIQLGRQSDAGCIVFSVRDYGPGVANAHRDKLFDLFYRGEDELTRKTTGTGIGLSLARQLVEGMGGRITTHHPDPGLEVRIELAPG